MRRMRQKMRRWAALAMLATLLTAVLAPGIAAAANYFQIIVSLPNVPPGGAQVQAVDGNGTVINAVYDTATGDYVLDVQEAVYYDVYAQAPGFDPFAWFGQSVSQTVYDGWKTVGADVYYGRFLSANLNPHGGPPVDTALSVTTEAVVGPGWTVNFDLQLEEWATHAPISGRQVTVAVYGLNGDPNAVETHPLFTDTFGGAHFFVQVPQQFANPPPFQVTAVASFAGDQQYNPVEVTHSFWVKRPAWLDPRLPPAAAPGQTVQVGVQLNGDLNGQPGLLANQPVTIAVYGLIDANNQPGTVSGVVYTDANGEAYLSVPVPANPATLPYDVTVQASFDGGTDFVPAFWQGVFQVSNHPVNLWAQPPMEAAPGETVTIQAHLEDPAQNPPAPLAGRTVSFAVYGKDSGDLNLVESTGVATTDQNGLAAFTFTVGANHPTDWPNDAVEVEVAFAGDSQYDGRSMRLHINVKQPQPANVVGTLLDGDGSPIANASVGIRPAGADPSQPGYDWSQERWAFTSGSGTFRLMLDPGQYKVFGVGSPAGWTEMNQAFEVLASHTTSSPLLLTVQLPKPNVTGTALTAQVDSNGNPIPVQWGWIQFRPTWVDQSQTPVSDPWKYERGAQIDGNGHFALTLDPRDANGNPQDWRVVGMATGTKWVQFGPNDYVFTAPDLSQASATPVNLTVQEPLPNLTGTALKADGSAVQRGWIQFRPTWVDQSQTSDPWKYERGAPTDDQGNFAVSLDTVYNNVYQDWRVVGMWTGSSWIEFPRTSQYVITAQQLGQPGGYFLNLQEPVPNLTGMALTAQVDSNGNPIPVQWGWIQFRPTWVDQSQTPVSDPWKYERGTQIDQNGHFAVTLDTVDPSGQPQDWRVMGMWTGSNWVQFGPNDYVVTAQQLNQLGGYNLTVQEPQANVTGQALKSDGSPVSWGFISFRPTAVQDGPDAWMYERGTQIDQNGNFSISLNAGVQYRVMGMWTGQNWVQFGPTAYVFTAPDLSQGAQPLVLEVREPQANVTGTALKADGSAVQWGWIQFRPTWMDQSPQPVQDPWRYERGTPIDQNGNFSISLDAGVQYRVMGMWTGQNWVQFGPNDHVFTAPDLSQAGATPVNLTIQEPQPNVFGVARDAGGNPVQWGWVAFKPAAAPPHDWSQVMGAPTNDAGEFQLVLPAGDWRPVGMWTGSQWIEFQGAAFTVPQTGGVSIEVAPPAANVDGTAYADANGTQVVANGWMEIRPAAYANDPNGWQYARWVPTDPNGAFSLYLDPGDYVIQGMWTASGWIDLGQSFTVDSANGARGLVVKPGAVSTGVSGTVTLNGQPLADALVAIRPAGAGTDWTQTKWVRTDASGNFTAALANGSYEISAVSTADTWYNVTNVTFTVSNDMPQVSVVLTTP